MLRFTLMTRIPDTLTPPCGPTWKLGQTPWRDAAPAGPARARVIVDNDFSGDPDDLYQLVHQVLSPSAEVRLVVASHLCPDDPFDPSGRSAENAARIVHDVFARVGLTSTDVIVTGSNTALEDRQTPAPSPATARIIAEAMREDVQTPLFYLAGGGLTDLASAWLIEPRIAERLTLIWIGGAEHPGLAVPPPGAMPIEYNAQIDLISVQAIFGDSDIPIWQVPRDAYRQCLVSDAELRARVRSTGELGRYLYDEVAHVWSMIAGFSGGVAQTYALGDSPLVLLSALVSPFEPDASSSAFVTVPTPTLADDGTYLQRSDARPLRVYTRLDLRLMFEDFFLALAEFDRWRASAE